MARRDKRHVLRSASCMVICVAVLANCQKQAVEPIALAPEDMCAYCKMAISEKRYAAEFIDGEGQPSKFDDIGCMGNFIKTRNVTAIAAYFVMDFKEGKWIKADNAYYVRSVELRTPMNGGIIAFQNESDAREAIGRYRGTALRFQDILNP